MSALDWAEMPELPLADMGPLVPWEIIRAETAQIRDTMETRMRINSERYFGRKDQARG